MYYQIAIGMKLFNSKVAKQELKEYGIYEATKKQYNNIINQVKTNIHKSTKTNEHYNLL